MKELRDLKDLTIIDIQIMSDECENLDSGLMEASVEFPRAEKMLYSGTDPESYITQYTSVYEERRLAWEHTRPIPSA